MKKLLIILLLLPAYAWPDSKSISNTTDIEDGYISSAAGTQDQNFGGATLNSVDGVSANYTRGLIRVKNLADSLGVGATISACGCSLYVSNESDGDYIYAYRVLKPWVEGTQNGGTAEPGATWNDWDNDAYEWGTVGGDNASDAGIDNSGDGSDYDRWATASGSISIITNPAWYNLELPDTLCQKWYDGTYNENGLILIGDASLDCFFNSIEHASNNPKFWFTYTTATGGKYWKILK